MVATSSPSTSNFDFNDEKYNTPASSSLPWAQIINPRYSKTGLKPFGMAIAQAQAKACGFKPDEAWKEITYEFGSGDPVDLYITQTPRIAIVRRGEVRLKDRETGALVGRLKDYYQQFKADKLKYKTFNRFIVFFVGKDNSLLHKSPLRITLNGAAGASFAQLLDYKDKNNNRMGFRPELEQAYAEHHKIAYSPKNDLFHLHGIYCPLIDAVEKGVGSNTAMVATTLDFEHPTAAKLAQYLISNKSPVSEVLMKAYNDCKDFDKDAVVTEENNDEYAAPTPQPLVEEWPSYDGFDEPPY